MVKVLAICGNGMGTSMMIKMKVKKFLSGKGIDASVNSGSLGDSTSMIPLNDIIMCSKHIAANLKVPAGKHLIALTNLLDEKEFGPKLLEIVNS
ncbi:PTS sugar transporter subunit IIB [Lentisphaerota bacterium ZTH]|nr:PTS sugar transporter subunit IIB [Lentisphaerota bacterium]WET05351.1 PTS sugar transporter subunit IIB [Lentisphaerota bacterium ZTH]